MLHHSGAPLQIEVKRGREGFLDRLAGKHRLDVRIELEGGSFAAEVRGVDASELQRAAEIMLRRAEVSPVAPDERSFRVARRTADGRHLVFQITLPEDLNTAERAVAKAALTGLLWGRGYLPEVSPFARHPERLRIGFLRRGETLFMQVAIPEKDGSYAVYRANLSRWKHIPSAAREAFAEFALQRKEHVNRKDLEYLFEDAIQATVRVETQIDHSLRPSKTNESEFVRALRGVALSFHN
ncbi:hypothetical protein [Thermosulfurimonas sp. F29]|uniref:hypothetical protein n=1 Tax=Thermosulfurimonas sp. F29 TaxID=2867247 RepID=UPI001C82D8AB|nr:hypothetical protein [Thermosulfurimonas sp. F29]MBX6424122.1 hypothetical protein [Thermosulfurimonas sp. F29]